MVEERVGAQKKSRSRSDVSLPQVLLGFSRGETLSAVADRLGLDSGAVARAVEAHARSLRRGDEPRSESDLRVTVHADGASRGNPGQAGVGWVIESRGETLLEGGRYIGTATNNVAEYEAVLLGLEKALELGASEVDLQLDSELVVLQIEGAYRVRDPKLIERHERLVSLIRQFSGFTVAHVSRNDNRRADELANRAIDKQKPKRKT
jgi:ribonuclease HI